MQKKIVFAVALIAAALSFAACGGDDTPPSVFDGGGTMDLGDVDSGSTDGGGRDGSTVDLGDVDGGGDPDGGIDVCGDGVLAAGEACDDGNTSSGDGCDPSCAVETGFTCDTADPTVCTAICGDGLVLGAEAGSTGCDDGDTTAGDGCDATCGVEPGFSCTGAPSACVAGCGDGLVVGTEGCDDGAMVDGDGCSSACAVESGWLCSGAPSACATRCGDGVAAGAEACDDGGTAAGDGCSATCAVEAGYLCTGTPSVCSSVCGDGLRTGAEACDDGGTAAGNGCSATCTVEAGYTCTGSPSVCATVCGDGVRAGAEACDDGGTAAGNGCSATCTVEAGYTCTGSPSVCATVCGDGVRAGAEACDDGGTAAGNGCSATCTVEAGYTCSGSPSACVTVCGDGVRVGAEACDDGGTAAGNGCSATCTVEAGYTCTGSPSVCVTTCGDGVRAGAEACDDGGTAAGNGCSATCTVEAGYTCTGSPSACTPICGDGLVLGAETCDDGNATAGDCCGATCLRETTIPIDGGAHTARCEFEPNGTAAAALPLGTFPMAGYLAGGVRPAADNDFFPIVVSSRVNLRVETFGPSSSTTCAAADTLIDLYAADGTTILATDDDAGINFCSLIDPATVAAARNLAPGTYYVRVRAFSATSTIPLYTVSVSACGDGVVSGSETCDDGALQDGDGCSAYCATEAGFVCTGAPSVCSYTVTYGGVPVAVPDVGAAVNVPVTVALPTCRIASVSTTHAWAPNHTFVGDLVISVVSPTTATATLSNRVGAGGDLQGPYTFATGGGTWPPAGAATPIPSGTYGADYSTMIGTIANGTWNLRVQDSSGGDTGSISAFSVTLTCRTTEVTTVVFPSTTSTVSSGGTLGAGGGGAYYVSGDYVEQSFARATAVRGLDLNFQMSDVTAGCAVGSTMTWNVLVNGTVVGAYSFAGGTGVSPRTITQSYSFPAVAAGPTATLRLQATSTVCGGGGSWNWIAGGSATLR